MFEENLTFKVDDGEAQVKHSKVDGPVSPMPIPATRHHVRLHPREHQHLAPEGRPGPARRSS